VPAPPADGDTRERVRALVDRHRAERGPLLPILHDVQAELGCVADDAITVLAEELNLSRAEVHGVVSFYGDLRRERAGHTVVRVCRGEACQAVGAEHVFAHACSTLALAAGEVTADRRVGLEQVFCFGNCALGPTVEIDGVLHGRVDAATLEGLIARERTGGAA
jgi:formate dehydrogenase subunit gamma